MKARFFISAIIAAIMMAAVLSLPATVSASEAEADVIRGDILAWFTEPADAPGADAIALDALRLDWTDASSDACRLYAEIAHSAILVFSDAVQTQGPGLSVSTYLFQQLEAAEYACRIAL